MMVNPFEMATQYYATLAEIYTATVEMQISAGMMVLETVHDAMQAPPAEYAKDGNVIYPQDLTPERFAKHNSHG